MSESEGIPKPVPDPAGDWPPWLQKMLKEGGQADWEAALIASWRDYPDSIRDKALRRLRTRT